MAYALITGAAKGIGRAIAGELAARDYHLILVDFDAENLQQTAEALQVKYLVPVKQIALDLSDKNAADYIFRLTRNYHSRLSIVINNAGYGLNGAFEKLELERQLNIVDVNIKAQLRIAHTFIPVLKQQKQAYLLNVGSTTSYQPVPYLSIYAASKAFVLSFTRSLRRELKNTPINVSCLSPGATNTHFVTRAGMQQHTLRLAERFNMEPEKVARIAIRGLFRKKAEIIPGITNRLNAILPRFAPKILTEKIAATIYRPRQEDPPETLPVLPTLSA